MILESCIGNGFQVAFPGRFGDFILANVPQIAGSLVQSLLFKGSRNSTRYSLGNNQNFSLLDLLSIMISEIVQIVS